VRIPVADGGDGHDPLGQFPQCRPSRATRPAGSPRARPAPCRRRLGACARAGRSQAGRPGTSYALAPATDPLRPLRNPSPPTSLRNCGRGQPLRWPARSWPSTPRPGPSGPPSHSSSATLDFPSRLVTSSSAPPLYSHHPRRSAWPPARQDVDSNELPSTRPAATALRRPPPSCLSTHRLPSPRRNRFCPGTQGASDGTVPPIPGHQTCSTARSRLVTRCRSLPGEFHGATRNRGPGSSPKAHAFGKLDRPLPWSAGSNAVDADKAASSSWKRSPASVLGAVRRPGRGSGLSGRHGRPPLRRGCELTRALVGLDLLPPGVACGVRDSPAMLPTAFIEGNHFRAITVGRRSIVHLCPVVGLILPPRFNLRSPVASAVTLPQTPPPPRLRARRFTQRVELGHYPVPCFGS